MISAAIYIDNNEKMNNNDLEIRKCNFTRNNLITSIYLKYDSLNIYIKESRFENNNSKAG